MERFAAAAAGVSGVELLHRSSDADHNRMVLSFCGPAEAVVEAARALAAAVYGEVDLTCHRGAHPRIGALDVVPFVPGYGAPESEALKACKSFGAAAADMGVPVLYYGRAASSPLRSSLPRIRSGQFEGLAAKLALPEWRPDEGPPAPHPTAGATAAGVRRPIVRFNANLDARDPAPARRIAAAIRESGGGLPHVQALGLELERRGATQVSMNLLRYSVTPLSTVVESLSALVRAEGVAITGSELIGPAPADALRGVDLASLNAIIEPGQILEPSFAGGSANAA